ncbi:hypothetical protein G3A39_42020 [Paraburkholderia aspalathi]|nr:hypothetical protein [Paraburkholderia aspalathi]
MDFVLIGTGDLGISYAAIGKNNTDAETDCTRVRIACEAKGIACGIFIPNIMEAKKRQMQGYQLVVLANDVDVIRDGFASETARFLEPPLTN